LDSARALGFEHREDVAGRIREPGDGRTLSAEDALVIRLVGTFPVDLEANPRSFSARTARSTSSTGKLRMVKLAGT
jgi:hypothetical protein